jgi:hypothetical protein
MRFRRDGRSDPLRTDAVELRKASPMLDRGRRLVSTDLKKRRGLTLMPQALYLTHRLFN